MAVGCSPRRCRLRRQKLILVRAIVTKQGRGNRFCSRRQNFEMGILLTLVLGVLIQEIVKAILRWWLETASNRIFLVGWQSEMRTR